MERSPQRPRPPAKLSDLLHYRLNMYALAASAAGVGALALAQPSEAKIIYKPIHKVIPPNSSYGLGLPGGNAFQFQNTTGTGTTIGSARVWWDQLWVDAPGGIQSGGVVGGSGTGRYPSWASDLSKGVTIGSDRHWVREGQMAAETLYKTTGGRHWYRFSGPWPNAKNGFLGLKFNIGRDAHYGWARLNVKVHGYHMTAILTGWAYESRPNKPIIAGKEHGADDASQPGAQPGTLGRLALGRR